MRFSPVLIALAFGLCLGAGACSKPPKPDDGKKAEKQANGQKQKVEYDDGPAGPLGPLRAGPVAFVGGDPISLEAFREIYDLKLKKYERRKRGMTERIDTRYRRTITERLIWAEVVRREAKALGVTFDPAELEEMVRKDRLGARNWEKDKLRRGESDESLKTLHTAQLLERAILEKEGAITVSPEEIDAEYETAKSSYNLDVDRIRLAQIVFEHGEGVSEKEAMAEAKQVYAAAKAPDADFGELAREHSDVVTRQSGGDLGIQRVDRIDTQLGEVAAKLKVGEVSKPFSTPAGVQIIKVVARYGPGPLPKEAIIDQIEGTVLNRKLQDARTLLKERLYEKYEVKAPMLEGLAPAPIGPPPLSKGAKAAAEKKK
jgi:parvulin-like peptidyl-prolyl isomerase